MWQDYDEHYLVITTIVNTYVTTRYFVPWNVRRSHNIWLMAFLQNPLLPRPFDVASLVRQVVPSAGSSTQAFTSSLYGTVAIARDTLSSCISKAANMAAGRVATQHLSFPNKNCHRHIENNKNWLDNVHNNSSSVA